MKLIPHLTILTTISLTSALTIDKSLTDLATPSQSPDAAEFLGLRNETGPAVSGPPYVEAPKCNFTVPGPDSKFDNNTVSPFGAMKPATNCSFSNSYDNSSIPRGAPGNLTSFGFGSGGRSGGYRGGWGHTGGHTHTHHSSGHKSHGNSTSGANDMAQRLDSRLLLALPLVLVVV